ncbi:hypothetical protein AK95_18755 [Paenibacillus sp. LC231]|nr:hypothetical protein AK95_18755 [Paenibacillus sp. LC231]
MDDCPLNREFGVCPYVSPPWKRQVKIKKERSFTDSKPSVRAALSAFIQVQEGFARLHNPSQIPI